MREFLFYIVQNIWKGTLGFLFVILRIATKFKKI